MDPIRSGVGGRVHFAWTAPRARAMGLALGQSGGKTRSAKRGGAARPFASTPAEGRLALAPTTARRATSGAGDARSSVARRARHNPVVVRYQPQGGVVP